MAGGEAELFVDFSIIIIVAALIILLFHRLRQPIVLGYLLAGILIGPYVTFFPTVQNIDVIDALAELAIIIIMFTLGLSFSFSKLRSIGLVAIVTGTIVIVSMILIGYNLGLAFGWTDVDSFFLGSMIAISSTVVITRGILERNVRSKRSSQIVTGILIVEDLAVVVILTLITGISTTGELRLEGLLITVINIGLFVVLFLAFGLLIAPRFARYAAGTGSRELVLMTALGLCFGFALLGFLVGFSAAIGAFVAGAVLGELPQRRAIAREVRPVRDMFAAVFFISIGMLFDPQFLMDYWLPILVIAGVFIVAKMILSTTVTFLFGVSAKTAMQVGLMMAVMGEFSFIIAREGLSSGIVSDFLYPTIVAASIMTIVVGTQLTKHQASVIGFVEHRSPGSFKRYAAFITLTINQLRSKAVVSDRFPETVGHRVRDILLEAVLVLCAALGLRLCLAYSGEILDALGLDPDYERPFQTLLIVVASVFIITALVALVRQVFRLIAEASLPIHIPGSTRRALKDTISYQVLRALVVMAVIVGGFLLFTFIGAPSAYTPAYLMTLVIVIVVLAYVFKRSVSSFNERFKATISDGLRVKMDEAPGKGPAESAKDLAVPQLLTDGDNLCNVVVEATSEDRGKPLKETVLWNREDVSVLAIRRDDELFIAPDEDEVLREKDILIILEGCAVRPRGGVD
ncbi:MAG: cation:proton antiporter [Candidatus Thermoplasmatota archaeon]|nr:cation:proton antiporter [Candidatus Thermoplasmatota archaeon]